MIPSYPKVRATHDKHVRNVFEGRVVIQEKIDGSQFSFGKFDGKMQFRTRGQSSLETNNLQFGRGIKTASLLVDLIEEGVWYRCEFLGSCKQNVIVYSRTPKGSLILFDVQNADGSFMNPDQLQKEAERLGLECVPTLWQGENLSHSIQTFEFLKELINKESTLGGANMEGCVIKNYNLIDGDSYVLAKFVCDDFKEKMQKGGNSSFKKDIVVSLIEELRTEARWDKAIQHLRDNGELTNTMKDMGPLCVEVQKDLFEEEEEYIMDQLRQKILPTIIKSSTIGLAEYYKAKLAS